MNGTAEFGIGVQMLGQGKQKYIDWTQMLFRTDNLFGSRIPVRVSGFSNIIRPFTAIVWMGVVGSLVAIMLAFWLIHNLYEHTLLLDYSLRKPADHWLEFLFYSLAMMIEPTGMKWFCIGSAGTHKNLW